MTINAPVNSSYNILNSIYWWLSDQKKDELFEMLKQDKENREKSKDIKLNKIINDIKENHVKIEDWVKMLWCTWKKIYIDLPATWNFKWYKFEFFVSNENRKENDLNEELVGNSFSMDEITKLIKELNLYLYENWIELDEWNNFDKQMRFRENEHIIKKDWIKIWNYENMSNKTWDVLKKITWLNWMYWLKDKQEANWKEAQVWWFFHHTFCFFNNAWMWNAPLLLKIK